jgi:hypothetical protein
MSHEMRTRICTFLTVVGVALVAAGLLEFGAGRFDVTSPAGQRAQCSSVFSGSGYEYTSADGYPMAGPADTRFDALCDSERAARKMWLWGLVGLGVVLVGGAWTVFWPTRPERDGAAK